MHKVVNINIAGRIFNLEENAFELLNHYISSLKSYFGNTPEGIEIIADIENRIAELLENKIKESTNISAEDISTIIASMGSPKDIAGDGDGASNESETNFTSDAKYESTHGKSRLFRDPDGKVVSGVCSGLAYYFDMDASIVRLIFIGLFFAGGSSVFLYLILLIIVPEAKSTPEKLAMRKEKINVDTIRKSVEEEFGRVKGVIEKGNYQGMISSFFEKIFHILGLFVKACFRAVGVFIGVVFAIVSIALFIGLISFITGNALMNGYHLSFLNPVYINFFENANDRLLSQVAIIAGFFALILFFFNISRSLLKQGKNFTNQKLFNRITIIVFLMSIVLGIISIAKTVSYFHSEALVENKILLDNSQKFFIIKTFKNEHHGMDFFVDNDSLNLRIHELRIEYTNGPAELIQRMEARGQNIANAKKNASNCKYNISIGAGVIILPESFLLINNQAYRKQEVSFVLRLPSGCKFTVDKKSNLRLINESDNNEMIREGEEYVVDESGIHCLGCSELSNELSVNGNEYQYNFPIDNFNSITLSSNFHVKIIKGNITRLLVNGLHQRSDLFVASGNGDLKVQLENDLFGNYDSDDIEILIETPVLNSIKINGAVDAEVLGFDSDKMNLICSGASKCFANFKSDYLQADISGASEIILKGQVNSMDVVLSGASNLLAEYFIAQNVDIKSSGASKATICVKKSLKAKATGASVINYSGSPSEENSFATGAGVINRRD